MAFVNFFYKMDIDNRIYYCLSCNFVIHLNFTINNVKKKYINLLELNDEKFTQSKNMLENENPKLNQSIDTTTYKVKKKKKKLLWTRLKLPQKSNTS